MTDYDSMLIILIVSTAFFVTGAIIHIMNMLEYDKKTDDNIEYHKNGKDRRKNDDT